MTGPTLTAARRSIARLSAPVAVLIAAIGARALFTIDCPPSRFWDTYSYVAVSLQLRGGHFPDVGVRPVGYPLFLAATSADGTGDTRSIRAQMLLGTTSSLLVFFSLSRVTKKRWLSLMFALLTTTFVDLLYAEATLYSETLCAFFVMCAVFALARADGASPRRWLGFAGASAGLALATIVRPIFLVPLMTLALALALLGVRRRVSVREVTAPIVVALLMVGPYAAWNGVTSGTPGVAVGPGTSLLNYAGFPAIYNQLPDRYAKWRDVYRAMGASQPDGFVGWWDVMPALDPAGYAALSEQERDRVALRLALSMITSAPTGYVRVWFQTLRDFLLDVDVGPGFYVDPEHMVEGDSDLSPRVRLIATRLQAFWGSANWIFSIVGALLLPSVVVLLGGTRPHSLPLTLLWVMLWATVLASTLLEPCPGQARYRWPLQLPFVVLSGWALAALMDMLPERRRLGAPWYALR